MSIVFPFYVKLKLNSVDAHFLPKLWQTKRSPQEPSAVSPKEGKWRDLGKSPQCNSPWRSPGSTVLSQEKPVCYRTRKLLGTVCHKSPIMSPAHGEAQGAKSNFRWSLLLHPLKRRNTPKEPKKSKPSGLKKITVHHLLRTADPHLMPRLFCTADEGKEQRQIHKEGKVPVKGEKMTWEERE